ncbi:membrane-spanning 4-domains subfamily A member 4D-like [Lithobates pipiens]
MATPSDTQSPDFVEYKVNPVGSNKNSAFDASISDVLPSAEPYQATAAIPQFNHSTLYQQTFMKGRPKLLGIVLIATSSLQIVLGIASIFTTVAISLTSGIDFWGPVLYITAGVLTIKAQAKFNICMIKSSFGLNVASTFISFLALVMVCVDLIVISHGNYHHYMKGSVAGGYFVLVTLLLSNLLLFSVSIFLSVFGCQAMVLAPHNVPQTFLIRNEVVIAMPEPSEYSNPEGSINISSA